MKKKILALVLALLLSCAAFSPALAEYVKTQYQDGSLCLRKGPSTSYATVGYVQNGQSITVLSRGSTWTRIRVDVNNKVGYIKDKYIVYKSKPVVPDDDDDGKYDIGRVVTKYASSTVCLRKGPGTSYKSITTLKSGTRVKILGSSGNWYLVETSSGKRGYMSKNYITRGTTGMTTVRLNVRKGPSTSYKIVTTLAKGEPVTITGMNNGWAKITCGKVSGYVSAKYLRY